MEICQRSILRLSVRRPPETQTAIKKPTFRPRTIFWEASDQKPKKIVMISSTSVYGTSDGSWVDESTDPLKFIHSDPSNTSTPKYPGNRTKRSPQRHSRGRASLAGIYGRKEPNRGRPKRAFKPAFSDDYTNRIHIEDVVGAIRIVSDKGEAGQVYIGTDDHPATQKEFYSWLYQKLSIPGSERGPTA